MFVNKIGVENIRSFEHFDIELSKSINVITGANNSGKSTLLKAIYLLQNPHTFRDQDLRIGTANSSIKIVLKDISENDAVLFQDHTKGAPKLPTLPHAEIYFPRTPSISNDAFYVNTEVSSHYPLKELNQEQRRDRFKDKFPYFPEFENKGNFIYPFFGRRRIGFFSPSASGDVYRVLDDYRNLPSKVQKVSNQRTTKEKFASLCKEILGFEVGIYPGENGENRIGLLVGYHNIIPLESMGEGTANILGLITLLLTEDHKLFLLEELENDIHPSALKKMLSLIIDKSHSNQFVISTHSNIVLKYLGAEKETKIFFSEANFDVERVGGELPLANISEISNSAEQRLQILERLGYELFDYELYKGYLILEESSAETLILHLISIFVPELENKMKTVASQGISDVENKLHSLNSLFMYLHRNEIYKNKAWILVDGDLQGKKLITELKAIYESWDESHFCNFEYHYFELYYPNRFQEQVAKVMEMKNGLLKQVEKKALLEKVIDWIKKDPDISKKELEISCAEVIAKLKVIAKSF